MPSADSAFALALKAAKTSFQNVPDNDDLLEKIEVKFRSIYENPFVDQLQELGSLEIGTEEARLILFQPDKKDIG